MVLAPGQADHLKVYVVSPNGAKIKTAAAFKSADPSVAGVDAAQGESVP